jgi:hypothetical protein
MAPFKQIFRNKNTHKNVEKTTKRNRKILNLPVRILFSLAKSCETVLEKIQCMAAALPGPPGPSISCLQ